MDGAQLVARSALVAAMIGGGGVALAEVFELGDGATLSVSLTTSYQFGIRAEDPNPKSFSTETDYPRVVLVPQAPLLEPYYVSTHTPKTYNTDDTNRNFKKGDPITDAFAALLDADLRYGDFGFKASANAYYDFVYHSGNSNDVSFPDGINKAEGPPDHFTGQTRIADGGRIRALDYFAYGTFHPFDTNLTLKIGNQVVAWGESLFFGNISLSQGPVETTRANSPGAEVKDILLPAPQASMNWGLTDRLSLLAYYQFDYEYNQLDGVGSYWSRADIIGPGAQFAYGATNPFPDVIAHYASACTLSSNIPSCASLGLPQQIADILSRILSENILGVADAETKRFDVAYRGEKKPDNAAQWGTGILYDLTDNLSTGLYYLHYHDKNPMPVFDISNIVTNPFRPGTVGGAVNTVCGLLSIPCTGLETAVTGAIDNLVAAVAPLYLPYSYRTVYYDNIDLVGASASTTLGPINVGFDFAYRHNVPVLVNGYVTGVKAPQPVRADVWQANINGLYVGGSTSYWDSLSLVAEVSLNHVAKYDTLYLYDVNGQPLQDGNGNNINAFRGLTGDSTSWGIQGLAEFGYTDVFPGGWDMAIPVIFGVAFGTPAYPGSLGALSGSGDVRLASGVKFRYLNNLEISVIYSAFFGSYNTIERPLTDRDNVVATVKYTF